MKTAIKRPTIDDLVERTESKDRNVLLKLHNYLLNDNNELYHYLDDKNELEDFLISRTDNAIYAYKSALLGDVPFPEEVKNQVLFIGIENSISEYIESLLDEVPVFKIRIEKAGKLKVVLSDLVSGSLHIFYDRLNTPYSEGLDELDAILIAYLEEQQGVFKF